MQKILSLMSEILGQFSRYADAKTTARVADLACEAYNLGYTEGRTGEVKSKSKYSGDLHLEPILCLLDDNQKIPAIKLLREQYKAIGYQKTPGLKECKDFVEALHALENSAY